MFRQDPASRMIFYVTCIRFPLLIFHFQKKATPINWYWKKSQQEKNANAFWLPSGVSVVFWWTFIVCINLDGDCWWTTNWRVNHILFLLVNQQVYEPRHPQFPKNQNIDQRDKIKSPFKIYSTVIPCYCFTVSYVFFCHR